MKTENLDKKLGIVGGGQLGKMLLSECNKMNISTSVLDPSEKSPCKSISDKFVLGDFNDFDTVYNMPMWLRKFIYHEIRTYYDKEKQEREKASRGKNSSSIINSDGTVNKQNFQNAQPRVPSYR